MSEGDVSLIRDEDVLRRLWQQTEDFSRKKEIRAHMYRLREERLRNLYSPEPTADAKDLKELSNAGWNVESSDRTTDDGRTHVKSVNADISGHYDVANDRGQFAARDSQRHAHTEYQDDTTSLKRDEKSASTAATEHVVRDTGDGTHYSSTTSSSTSSSKVQQSSSIKHEVPYTINDDYEKRTRDTNDQLLTARQTNNQESIRTNTDYEQSLRRNDYETGELVSRKVEYPDDNTKVIVETRCLPDGTRVTSTKREFRAPVVQSARSEQHSHQSRSESKSSFSSQYQSDHTESKNTRSVTDNRINDIVDSQRHADDYDFQNNRVYSNKDNDNSQTHRTNRYEEVTDHTNKNATINKQDYSNEDYSKTTQYRTNEHETKVDNQVFVSKVNKQDHLIRDDYSQVDQRGIQRHDKKVDETDRREIITDDVHYSRDSNNKEPVHPKDIKERIQPARNTDERTHIITSDKKVEQFEKVDKKTTSDQYQTTYQSDFTQRKISTDWSPTHQAWASTLRADTPTTTRPSTRASSPGSRTFKSSTSSLRSSVSPDKAYRKPSSRGGSPSKVDRQSPTRTSTTSDRYSSTRSTHSVTETKTDRYTSPEKKPPQSRSPTRPGYSPERKTHDGHQRSSISPEKRPQAQKPSPSPDRKLGHRGTPDGLPRTSSPAKTIDKDGAPIQSPERKPGYPTTSLDDNPRIGSLARPINRDESPTRTVQSPERKPHNSSPTRPVNHNVTPTGISRSPERTPGSKPSFKEATPTADRDPRQSPERKPGHQQDQAPGKTPSSGYKPRSSVSPEKRPSEGVPKSFSPTRSSQSPDRKHGHLPTAPVDLNVSPDRKSPTKHVPSQSPDRKSEAYNKSTKIREDHYKFVDEETKTFTRVDQSDINNKRTATTTQDYTSRRSESPVPSGKRPSEDAVDYCRPESSNSTSLRQGSRSPSPAKGPVSFVEDKFSRMDKTVTDIINTDSTTYENITQDVSTKHHKSKVEDTMPSKQHASREPSPTKYGTYDKKKPYTNEDTEATTVKDTKDVKQDTLLRRETTPQKVPNLPSSPTKRSPRLSASPTKSPTKDIKYKDTTDFLSTERTTETVNKRSTKERPRQLVTPSSSPTRKPKPTEPEPSTGQSSPTTSVSGFVYFGSPRQETLVTDLDDQEFISETNLLDDSSITSNTFKRPETLDVKRSPSPSKIPCRSPSPEKGKSPAKESLPRKSSLKKPSIVPSQVSPTEKPPTSFLVSPNGEFPDFPNLKDISKDQPEKVGPKAKPPLERRETYEERCMKILGMMNETNTSTSVTNESTYQKETETKLSSTGGSPCRSPITKKSSPFDNYPTKKDTIKTKSDVAEFISREKEDIVKTTSRHEQPPKAKTPSRETSPAKLQDIMKETQFTHKLDESTEKYQDVTITKSIKSKTPDRKPAQKPSDDVSKPSPKAISPVRLSQSPDRKRGSKAHDSKPSILPDRKSPSRPSPSDSAPGKARVNPDSQPVHLPTRASISPERKPNYMKPTTAVTSKYEVQTTEEFKETTANISKRLGTTEFTQRHVRGSSPDHSRTSPAPMRTPVDRDSLSPERNSAQKPCPTRVSPEKKLDDNLKGTDDSKTPSYMKRTTAISSKFDSSTTEDVKQTTKATSKTAQTYYPEPKSPTRKHTNLSEQPNQTDHTRNVSPAKSCPQNLSPEQTINEKTPTDKHSKDLSSKTMPVTPGYMKTTASATCKFDTSTTEDIQEITTEIKQSSTRGPKPTESQPKDQRRSVSPTKPSKVSSPKRPELSPERRPGFKQPSSPTSDNQSNKPVDKSPQDSSVTKPSYNKTKVSSQCDTESLSEDFHSSMTSEITETEHYPSSEPQSSPTRKFSKPTDARTTSPSRPTPPTGSSPQKQPSPETKPGFGQPRSNKCLPTKQPDAKNTSPNQHTSVDKKPGYMKPTTVATSNYETTEIEDAEEIIITTKDNKYPSPRSSKSPTRPKETALKPSTVAEEPRQLRTPSPTKKVTKTTEISTDFIISEREQEVMDRVKNSLRKLSPERNQRSPSREQSPGKTTTSLKDIEVISNKYTRDDKTEIIKKETTSRPNATRPEKLHDDKPAEPKASSKPSSRTVSPIKKTPSSPTKLDKSPESPTKSRSISPKKLVTGSERPQSPQVQKASGIKPREPVLSHLIRKPTPATLTPSKIEKLAPGDIKKAGGLKQNSFTKTTTTKTTVSKTLHSPTSKNSEPEPKRMPTLKGIRDINQKNNIDAKVTRTTSDITIRAKKSSPQRMKSKPEIQVNDVTTTKTTITSKIYKTGIKEPHSKLPNSKPKSATALNTSTEDDDVIIDVQQSKSSRENSPDRICPTPINFGDDVGTPRFPDEVSEPDDEFDRRTHHIIHETESLVDDIVEICEDDELFVKRTDTTHITEDDESLLSVNDKVSRFTNKNETIKKPKETTANFKDTERKVHSDFVEQNLKSDECLLSVSEKVNKFAKGPRDTKDSKSPSRRIVDEYDRDTVYQDDYTKLSVNDKAHLFVETAENVKTPKLKPFQKVERPDLSNVDESIKSDDCLLSVSDKVNKFVKTAEHFLIESHEVEEKEKKIKEQHDKIMRQIVETEDDVIINTKTTVVTEDTERKIRHPIEPRDDKSEPFAKDTASSKPKAKITPNPKVTEKLPPVKITNLRGSEAVKKAKALFENIASTTQKTKDTVHSKTTKLTDIGVMKKTPKSDSTTVLHPSVEDDLHDVKDECHNEENPHVPRDRPSSGTLTRPHIDDKPRSSPSRLTTQSPEVPRSKSPMRHTVETVTTKTKTSKYPSERPESPRGPETEKPDKIPGYLRPTKTSQSKDETKVFEGAEVSSRRGSGKFGVELKRTSVERSTVSSERRSLDQHQSCIEDILDLDLLEQMLEKVTGYEQRRRIRAQIRIAKKVLEDQGIDSTTYAKTTKRTTETIVKTRSPERQQLRSPERTPKSTPQKTSSPDRHAKTPQKIVPERIQPKDHVVPTLNGHAKDNSSLNKDTRQRPHSPEKPASKTVAKTQSAARQPSPDKKTRVPSPSKAVAPQKPKPNRFNEYASAYIKRVGLKDASPIVSATKTKKMDVNNHKTVKHVEEVIVEKHSTATSKTFTDRSSSKEVIEIVQVNGKRSPSPEKKLSPERKAQSPVRKTQSPERKAPSPVRKAQSPERKSPERLYQRTPSPDFKRQKSDVIKNDKMKTTNDTGKKTPTKPAQEEKPSWVTNRNLKKINSESRTFSSRKLESEKGKYRAPSPSKVISRPIDVITSSYGPGPLDADGKPLFGIKALRNSSNYQVKGTVIRQEFHSRNGAEPEGSVSVTAYSSEPAELEQLLAAQGEPPSRLHGLAAITTTKRFGGHTGASINEVHTKEDRASLEQFTHSDRRLIEHVTEDFDLLDGRTGHTRRVEVTREERDMKPTVTETRTTYRREENDKRGKEDRRERHERREDKKTVRQNSVKSLTEKFIKSASESTKSERITYPKAGLILRTSTMKDSVSSDSSAHAGLARTDSEHSLASVEETGVTSLQGVTTTTTSSRQVRGQERSFLDSTTKVTGVQDILTRMKNADIVIQEGDSQEDTEARALLNKFLGATVLMAGMQGYVTDQPGGTLTIKQESVHSSSGGKVTSSRTVEEVDLEQCWDERVLRKLLDECTDYEQRRRLRARLRTLMAEQEACASAVTEALAAAGEGVEGGEGGAESREEAEVTVTSSVRRNSSEKTVSSSTTTKTSRVVDSMSRPAPKPVSPFAKFRQLEKQNSLNNPKM